MRQLPHNELSNPVKFINRAAARRHLSLSNPVSMRHHRYHLAVDDNDDPPQWFARVDKIVERHGEGYESRTKATLSKLL